MQGRIIKQASKRTAPNNCFDKGRRDFLSMSLKGGIVLFAGGAIANFCTGCGGGSSAGISATGHNFRNPAIVNVMSSEGIILDKASVLPGGESHAFTDSNNDKYVISASKVDSYNGNAQISVSKNGVTIADTSVALGGYIEVGNRAFQFSDIGKLQSDTAVPNAILSVETDIGPPLFSKDRYLQIAPNDHGFSWIPTEETSSLTMIDVLSVGVGNSGEFATIKLEKQEAVKAIVNVGDCLETTFDQLGDYPEYAGQVIRIRLDGISVPKTESNACELCFGPSVNLAVLDESNNSVKTIKSFERQTQDVTLPDGTILQVLPEVLAVDHKGRENASWINFNLSGIGTGHLVGNLNKGDISADMFWVNQISAFIKVNSFGSSEEYMFPYVENGGVGYRQGASSNQYELDFRGTLRQVPDRRK